MFSMRFNHQPCQIRRRKMSMSVVRETAKERIPVKRPFEEDLREFIEGIQETDISVTMTQID